MYKNDEWLSCNKLKSFYQTRYIGYFKNCYQILHFYVIIMLNIL